MVLNCSPSHGFVSLFGKVGILRVDFANLAGVVLKLMATHTTTNKSWVSSTRPITVLAGARFEAPLSSQMIPTLRRCPFPGHLADPLGMEMLTRV